MGEDDLRSFQGKEKLTPRRQWRIIYFVGQSNTQHGQV
jgi:hypothetical protein